jgi:hypothetical protein
MNIAGRGIKYLLVIERQMLRKIFRPIHCQEGSKISSNKELQYRYRPGVAQRVPGS